MNKVDIKAPSQGVQFKEDDLETQERKAKQLKLSPKPFMRPNLKPMIVEKRQLELNEQKRRMAINVAPNLPKGKEVATAFNIGAGFGGKKQVSQRASVGLNMKKAKKR